MKKTILSFASLLLSLAFTGAAPLLQYDFTGATATATYNTQSSTFNDPSVLASIITRGAGVSTNNAANGFRGTGFSNDGIALTNTDFFQFTLTATSGNTLNVSSITGNFVGTASFYSTAPNVTVQYAYSLDSGTTFTLASTSTALTAAQSSTYTFAGTDATALTGVSSVIFKLFASGGTTTGGFGYGSAATAGTIGLSIDGSVASVPEPSTYAMLIGGTGLMLIVMRRKRTA